MDELKKQIIGNNKMRDVDFRDPQMISDVMLRKCFSWCFQRPQADLEQRREEMIERVLNWEFSNMDSMFRLANDRCMLSILNMVLEMPMEKPGKK